MATRKASQGIRDLIERTAGGKIHAIVTVDQIYAQNQHESLWFQHPRGGRAKYLEAPMFEEFGKWFQSFADDLLDEGFEAVRGWHSGPGTSLQDVVMVNAPVEFGDLRQSAGLRTRVGTRTRFERPPLQPRLQEWELEAKDHMRHLGLGYR